MKISAFLKHITRRLGDRYANRRLRHHGKEVSLFWRTVGHAFANLVISNRVSTMITRWLFGLRDLPRFPGNVLRKQMEKSRRVLSGR